MNWITFLCNFVCHCLVHLFFYGSQITEWERIKKFPCSTTFPVHSRLSKDNYENILRDYRFESNVVFELCVEAFVNASVTLNYFNCCEDEFVGTLLESVI